jgi:hypothetical protein
MIEAPESHADALTRLEVVKMTFSEPSARIETHELGRRSFKHYSMLVQPHE